MIGESKLGRFDTLLVAVIGWCHRRLSLTARMWLAQELQWRKER